MTKVILPTSYPYQLWSGLVSITAYLSSILVTFQAVFNSQLTDLLVANYTFDLLYLIDVILKFHVAVYEDGTLITDRIIIRKHYLRGTFLLDLISVLPFEIFAYTRKFNYPWHYEMRLFKLNRILRFYRLPLYFSKYFYRPTIFSFYKMRSYPFLYGNSFINYFIRFFLIILEYLLIMRAYIWLKKKSKKLSFL